MRATRPFAVLTSFLVMFGWLPAFTADAQVIPTEVEWIRQFGGVALGHEEVNAHETCARRSAVSWRV